MPPKNKCKKRGCDNNIVMNKIGRPRKYCTKHRKNPTAPNNTKRTSNLKPKSDSSDDETCSDSAGSDDDSSDKKVIKKQNITRQISDSVKKMIAGRQFFKCANKLGSNIRGLELYNCPLWEKNNSTCGSFDESNYEIDHILEKCNGGDNSISNLQALCGSCHNLKTSRMKSKLPINNIPAQIITNTDNKIDTDLKKVELELKKAQLEKIKQDINLNKIQTEDAKMNVELKKIEIKQKTINLEQDITLIKTREEDAKITVEQKKLAVEQKNINLKFEERPTSGLKQDDSKTTNCKYGDNCKYKEHCKFLHKKIKSKTIDLFYNICKFSKESDDPKNSDGERIRLFIFRSENISDAEIETLKTVYEDFIKHNVPLFKNHHSVLMPTDNSKFIVGCNILNSDIDKYIGMFHIHLEKKYNNIFLKMNETKDIKVDLGNTPIKIQMFESINMLQYKVSIKTNK